MTKYIKSPKLNEAWRQVLIIAYYSLIKIARLYFNITKATWNNSMLDSFNALLIIKMP